MRAVSIRIQLTIAHWQCMQRAECKVTDVWKWGKIYLHLLISWARMFARSQLLNVCWRCMPPHEDCSMRSQFASANICLHRSTYRICYLLSRQYLSNHYIETTLPSSVTFVCIVRVNVRRGLAFISYFFPRQFFMWESLIAHTQFYDFEFDFYENGVLIRTRIANTYPIYFVINSLTLLPLSRNGIEWTYDTYGVSII